MTPGFPLPPALPHDPRSLLLNAALGFRSQALRSGGRAAVVDAERSVLTLPRLASAERDLAEPSGSLGGVRPPSNVAIGPSGDIYLLQRARLELWRFDACRCAFERVPCFGGEGGGARQLRNPGGIAIACGNLYVCDTGIESAPAAACEELKAIDARVRGEITA